MQGLAPVLRTMKFMVSSSPGRNVKWLTAMRRRETLAGHSQNVPWPCCTNAGAFVVWCECDPLAFAGVTPSIRVAARVSAAARAAPRFPRLTRHLGQDLGMTGYTN